MMVVKGVRHYKAPQLYWTNSLHTGMSVMLQHEPHNHYDKNAVAVKLMSNGAMLGHLSRELAPKYVALVLEKRIVDASIADINLNGRHINIKIKVVYDQYEKWLDQIKHSLICRSAADLPCVAGVYSIRNITSGRQYIGSSNNVKKRIYSHLRDLNSGSHVNSVLQKDYTRYGCDAFEVSVLQICANQSDLEKSEACEIARQLYLNNELYNMTIDGKGKIHVGGSRNVVAETVSNRRTKEHETLNTYDCNFFDEKRRIAELFDKRLSASLPDVDCGAYFIVAFLVVSVTFNGLARDPNYIKLVIISAIIAWGFSRFMKWNIHENFKQSDRYQKLLKERDEALYGKNQPDS